LLPDPGTPPGRRPDLTRPRLLPACLHPAPWLQQPRPWHQGKSRQTNQCVDHHGGDRPERPYPHHWAPVTSRSLPSLILQGRLPLEPCHHCGSGSTGLRPCAIATAAPPWGTAAPLRTHTHAPNRDRLPGNRPRLRSRGVEWGQGSSNRPREWRRTILSYGSRPELLSDLGRQSHSQRPSCDSPPPSPRHQSHRRLASLRGPLPPGHRPDAGALGTRPPLPAPGGKVGEGTPVPPWSRRPVRKFFQKNHSQERDPPG
jgi:hypothetical protein